MMLLRAFRLVLFALLPWVVGVGLWGNSLQEVSAASLVSHPELTPSVALAHRTEQLKQAFLNGNETRIQTAIQEIELVRRTYGTMDATPLVEAMALWARQLGNEGKVQLGLQVLREVEGRWATRHAAVLGSRIALLRQEGVKGYILSLPDIWELTRLRLTHPQQRWLWIVQHAAWLRMMATLMLWAWAFVLVLRYRRVLRYLWEEPLARRGLSSIAIGIVGAFILALPVIGGLDPSVSALLSLVMLVPFLSLSEIRASYLVILLQLVHPGLVLLEPMATLTPKPSLVALQLQPQVRSYEDAGVLKLPKDDQTFLMGWRHLMTQEWAAAESTFAGLEGRLPEERAQVLNNRGVARYHQGRVDEAEQDFNAAFSLMPTAPEILLNQGLVSFKRLNSVMGFAKQDEARRLAPEVVESLMSANQARTEQRAIAMPLPDSPVRTAVLSSADADEGTAKSRVSSEVQSRVLMFGIGIPLLALVVFSIRLRRSFKLAHPTQCARCGDAFHTTDSPDPSICPKCHHLFVLKDGLHGESRKRKVEEVGAFQLAQRWIHRGLVVLIPGADLCFLGRTRQGVTELSFLCMALGVIFATGRTIRYPGEVMPEPTSSWLPIGLLLLVVLFLRSWFKLVPRRA